MPHPTVHHCSDGGVVGWEYALAVSPRRGSCPARVWAKFPYLLGCTELLLDTTWAHAAKVPAGSWQGTPAPGGVRYGVNFVAW